MTCRIDDCLKDPQDFCAIAAGAGLRPPTEGDSFRKTRVKRPPSGERPLCDHGRMSAADVPAKNGARHAQKRHPVAPSSPPIQPGTSQPSQPRHLPGPGDAPDWWSRMSAFLSARPCARGQLLPRELAWRTVQPFFAARSIPASRCLRPAPRSWSPRPRASWPPWQKPPRVKPRPSSRRSSNRNWPRRRRPKVTPVLLRRKRAPRQRVMPSPQTPRLSSPSRPAWMKSPSLTMPQPPGRRTPSPGRVRRARMQKQRRCTRATFARRRSAGRPTCDVTGGSTPAPSRMPAATAVCCSRRARTGESTSASTSQTTPTPQGRPALTPPTPPRRCRYRSP